MSHLIKELEEDEDAATDLLDRMLLSHQIQLPISKPFRLSSTFCPDYECAFVQTHAFLIFASAALLGTAGSTYNDEEAKRRYLEEAEEEEDFTPSTEYYVRRCSRFQVSGSRGADTSGNPWGGRERSRGSRGVAGDRGGSIAYACSKGRVFATAFDS